tara:strand:- start:352 stop:528 length:177 start_codon:yes stop_codon:yes gene_type:complete
MKEIKEGSRVSIKCDVYKNNRKFYGTITAIFPLFNQAKVRIDGNKKSTTFCTKWMKPI